MSEKKYRVGIIGSGRIANAHAQGYQGVDEVEIDGNRCRPCSERP